MYLKHVPTGELVEVLDLQDVVNPHTPTIRARILISDRMVRADEFHKDELSFPSGEDLPHCWSHGIHGFGSKAA
jgi:hypothetical protein